MPIFSAPEAASLSPFFQGDKGRRRFERLERLSAVDRVNALHDRVEALYPPGPDFAKGLLEDIGVDYGIGYPERLAQLPDGPFITISNHAYGHIDGIMLVDLIGHLRPDMKLMVNRVLNFVRGLGPHFISVDPIGDSRDAPTVVSISGVRKAIAQIRAGGPLSLFPAGAVSDLKIRGGLRIEDRDWQDAAIHLIAKAKVPIIPVRFVDRNSLFYYLLGLIDSRVRLLRLCHEIFNKRDKAVRLAIGQVITPEEQAPYLSDLDGFKSFLRASVYDMPLPASYVSRSELSGRGIL